MGATAARPNPLSSTPSSFRQVQPPRLTQVSKSCGKEGLWMIVNSGCKKRRGDVWVPPSVGLGGWMGEYRAVQTRRRLAASKPSMLYSPLRHYAASIPARPYPSHQPPAPTKMQLLPNISAATAHQKHHQCKLHHQRQKIVQLVQIKLVQALP